VTKEPQTDKRYERREQTDIEAKLGAPAIGQPADEGAAAALIAPTKPSKPAARSP
jgi:hypothetical protein